MSSIWQQMQLELDHLARQDLLRNPAEVGSAAGARIEVGGRTVTCLCSNDYLGLAGEPEVRQAAIEAIQQWGVGAGASRLVSGTMQPHRQLEQRLAEFKRCQAAVATSTGWMANHAAIHALAGSGDLVLSDKLNHASIIDAAMTCGARLRTYPHGDLQRLGRLLAEHRGEHRRCLVVSDSLFSMDGDLARLQEMVELKHKYDATLLIDEAHATGVLGEGGRGAAELLGVEGQIDATVGTLSKAIGALGGFVAGPAVLIETIRNMARPYVYTTAMPPAICCAAMKSLDIIEQQPQRRARLLENAAWLRGQLKSAGLDIGESASQIIPVIIGEAAAAMAASKALFERGFFIPAIRPPTVPKGTSRLRISLSSEHSKQDLQALVTTLGMVCERIE